MRSPLVLDQCEPGLGENIRNQWSFPGVPDLSPREAVSWWASEKQWYNFDTNTCAPPPGETCGHYTQVVWSSTRGVGCGRAQRTTEDADGKKKNWVFWVCNYTPGGNITVNGELQKPYSVGAPGGQAGGDHTTRHFIEVRFTHMRVHDCNETGKCDWNLMCRLGNQPEKLLLDNVEAGSRAEPLIDKVLTQEGTLPVTVGCKVEEHDGGIDPGWEHIGTRSIPIPQEGKSSIRIAHLDEDGDVDEGDVSIFFDVQSKVQTGLTGQPLPTAPTTQPSDRLLALRAAGIDFSVPGSGPKTMAQQQRIYALSRALRCVAEAAGRAEAAKGKRLRQPVEIDVIRSKYEDVLGASSPRSVADVDLALLKAAVVESYNERYGEVVRDFQSLMR